MALVPYTIACLGFPRFLGLAIDWTMFETTLPSGKQMRYQVLRVVAVPRKGRALPLLRRWPMIGTTSVQTREPEPA
jgi:hypothetical protein